MEGEHSYSQSKCRGYWCSVGYKGLNNFKEIQIGFLDRQVELAEKQFELLELQSKTAEQFDKVLDSQKKAKVESCDFNKFKKM